MAASPHGRPRFRGRRRQAAPLDPGRRGPRRRRRATACAGRSRGAPARSSRSCSRSCARTASCARRSSPATRSRCRRSPASIPTDPELSDRFELFINGSEFANGYSELNDPVEQRLRFEDEQRRGTPADLEARLASTRTTCRALEYGMPPAGGLGVGIDRLVMLLAGVDSIKDVILFPTLGRNRGHEPTRRPCVGRRLRDRRPPRRDARRVVSLVRLGRVRRRTRQRRPTTALAGGDRSDDVRRVVIRPVRLTIDVTPGADVVDRRVPATAPAVEPARRTKHAQPRRHLRSAQHRRLDRPRPGRGRRSRRRRTGSPRRRRGDQRQVARQVPADARLRRSQRRPDRRRFPRPARRPPRRGHDGDARGVLQLQRGHARRRDGRGAHLAGRRRRRQFRHRRRGVDHGHALGRRHGADQHRRELPARRERRPRHQPRRRLRRRGRSVPHGRDARETPRRRGGQGPRAVWHLDT